MYSQVIFHVFIKNLQWLRYNYYAKDDDPSIGGRNVGYSQRQTRDTQSFLNYVESINTDIFVKGFCVSVAKIQMVQKF